MNKESHVYVTVKRGALRETMVTQFTKSKCVKLYFDEVSLQSN